MSKRSSSSKLSFYDLNDSCLKVQVMADLRKSELDKDEFAKLHAFAKRGDIVGVTGFPGKTKRGELSIFPRSFTVLSPCLHMLPSPANNKKQEIWSPGHLRHPQTYVLKDQETRFRQRYLDLMMNNHEIPQIFKTIDNINKYIRRFLSLLDFVEVTLIVYEIIILHPFFFVFLILLKFSLGFDSNVAHDTRWSSCASLCDTPQRPRHEAIHAYLTRTLPQAACRRRHGPCLRDWEAVQEREY